MQQAYGHLNMSRGELNQLSLQEVISKWQRTPSDTGSGEVQVAVFSERILRLSSHMSRHHKDNMTKRRLQMLVLQRNRMLKYMRREQRERYNAVVTGQRIRPNKNFDPTITPSRASWAAKRRRKQRRAAAVKAKSYGSEKSAKGRASLRSHAYRQTALHRARSAATKANAGARSG